MNVKARYTDGVFTPLEPVDLDEGAEVLVSITPASADANGGASVLRIMKELDDRHPPTDLSDLPVDLAENAKHYLYGRPKA